MRIPNIFLLFYLFLITQRCKNKQSVTQLRATTITQKEPSFCVNSVIWGLIILDALQVSTIDIAVFVAALDHFNLVTRLIGRHGEGVTSVSFKGFL